MDIVYTFNIQTLSDRDELSGTAQKISEKCVRDGKNSSDEKSGKKHNRDMQKKGKHC